MDTELLMLQEHKYWTHMIYSENAIGIFFIHKQAATPLKNSFSEWLEISYA